MRSHGQGVGLLGHDEQGRRRRLREEVRQEEDLRQTQVRQQVLHRRLSRLQPHLRQDSVMRITPVTICVSSNLVTELLFRTFVWLKL